MDAHCVKKTLNALQGYLSSFLLMNIIPVICHQEDVNTFSKLISHTQLMHCKISTPMKRILMVEKAGIVKHCMAMPTMIKMLITEKRKLFFPSLKEIKEMELMSLFCMHLVKDGEIEQSYFYKSLTERPDYGAFIFKLGRDSKNLNEPMHNNESLTNNEESESSSQITSTHLESSPEEYIPKLMKLFPTMKEIFRAARKHVAIVGCEEHVQQRQQQQNHQLSSLSEEKETSHDDHAEKNSSSATIHEAPHTNRLSIPKRKSSCSSTNSTSSIMSSKQVTVRQVLENATMRNYFKAYLSNIFCLELVIFLEQVIKYKILCKRSHNLESNINTESSIETIDIQIPPTERTLSEKEMKANYIIATFLEEDAMFRINTSKKLINAMQKKLDEKGCTIDLFDEIARDIETSMLVHLFETFKDTNLYREMMQRQSSMANSNN
ncbi:hypothetical protein FDP41_009112 [Naegleria fowleri]|uniref:RGS domain-containing protein n=1 Tax=Naegleria fowleri TaxID=5763 RepID=A0A6A5AZZ0_NAEFO|nr:uncharacterized protein FDP41_009112 [Naegleria fowleri]KAF0972863.1 hypothetical protein FDP41_009112 [Naegleria fowleri]